MDWDFSTFTSLVRRQRRCFLTQGPTKCVDVKPIQHVVWPTTLADLLLDIFLPFLSLTKSWAKTSASWPRNSYIRYLDSKTSRGDCWSGTSTSLFFFISFFRNRPILRLLLLTNMNGGRLLLANLCSVVLFLVEKPNFSVTGTLKDPIHQRHNREHLWPSSIAFLTGADFAAHAGNKRTKSTLLIQNVNEDFALVAKTFVNNQPRNTLQQDKRG